MKGFLVGPKGGTVDIVDRQTGECVHSFQVGPGLHPVARFAPYLGGRFFLNGPHVVQTLGNFETCKPAGQFESAANPFWKLTAAQKQVNEMRRMLARTEALAKRTAKMQQSMKRAKAAQPALMPPTETGKADAGDVSAT